MLAGRYQIIRKIGHGGTGEIYLAEDLNLERNVAVKRLRAGRSSVDLNRNEVDLLKALRHPNLPQVYDYLVEDGEVYTVVEYIEGRDLTAWIAEGGSRLSQEILFDWLLQLCSVLDYLHSHNVIHSDIKPGNIMITLDGQIRLIDFNISFLLREAVKGYSSSYASPEQIAQAKAIELKRWDGKSYLDARTDVYSLAATFYHLISGRLPVPGSRNPPLAQMNLPYQRDFLRILDRAMERRPARRYASARQMGERLQRWREEQNRRRRVAWQQLLFWGSGIFLITTGLICILVGRRELLLSDYNSAFRQISDSFDQWDLEQAAQLSADFLEEERFASLHERNPERTAEAYAIRGENWYWQSEYVMAVTEYKKALELDPREDCVKRCVIALLKAGDTRQAGEICQTYAESMSSALSQAFLQAEVAYQEGDYAQVLSLVESVDSPDAEMLELGALAAQSQGALEEAEAYLGRCYQLTGKTVYLRWQGETCYLLAVQHTGSNQAQQWIDRALRCYDALCSAAVALEEDELWRAFLHLQRGSLETAEQEFRLLAEDSDSGLVGFQACLYLTLLNHQLGDESDTRNYCSRAVTRYEQLSEAERLQIDAADLTQLRAIGSRYGYSIEIE